MREYRWTKIKYECISDVCYGCGTLGHTLNQCEVDVVMSVYAQKGCSLYGPRSSLIKTESTR